VTSRLRHLVGAIPVLFIGLTGAPSAEAVPGSPATEAGYDRLAGPAFESTGSNLIRARMRSVNIAASAVPVHPSSKTHGHSPRPTTDGRFSPEFLSALADADTTEENTFETGFLVYRQQYCGVCHTSKRARTGGLFGPTHDGIRATAEARIHEPAYSGEATNAAEYLRESIVNPSAYFVPGFAETRYPMPSYAHLSDTEIDALVTMLLADD